MKVLEKLVNLKDLHLAVIHCVLCDNDFDLDNEHG